jgi:hypothetical protein
LDGLPIAIGEGEHLDKLPKLISVAAEKLRTETGILFWQRCELSAWGTAFACVPIKLKMIHTYLIAGARPHVSPFNIVCGRRQRGQGCGGDASRMDEC